MRHPMIVLAAVCGVALAATPCEGQRLGKFEDSWYWGAKAGVNTFSAGSGGTTSVPTWGLDWLITRQHGGLYVSADQAYFNRTVTSADAGSPNGKRDVDVRNLNRVGFGIVAFPSRMGVLTPYGSIGAAISVLGRAVGRPDSAGGAPSQQFIDQTDKLRSRASLVLMAGVQTQSRRLGFFIQESIMPSGRDFLIPSTMSILEIGLRHSFGSPSESEH